MFEKLLLEFEKIPSIRIEENWFSICGFPHYEKVCSNVLQFFLDTNREHGLHDLFIKSLFSFIDTTQIPTDEYYSVSTEFMTKKGNFIDLILESESDCVIIENKIRAWIYNDLDDYLDSATERAQNISAFILSLTKQTPQHKNWTYITYSELFDKVRSNIGNYITLSNRRYIVLLFEFIENIENQIGGEGMDEKFISFLSKNEAAVQEIIRKTNEVRNELRKKVQRVGRLISEEVKDERLKQWAWRKGENLYDVAVSDLQYLNGTITVHSELFLEGWHFSVFTRDNCLSVDELVKVCSGIGISGSLKAGRFELTHQFDFSAKEQDVAEFASKVIQEIRKKSLK